MNMKRKIMGYSMWELGLVLGGGLVVGGMVRMLGLRGAPLYAVGVLAGYVLRGMRPGTGWKEPAQIADLRSKFAHAVPDNGHVRMNANGNGNGNGGPVPITGATANEFIVPDPSAAPAVGSEGALAGQFDANPYGGYGILRAGPTRPRGRLQAIPDFGFRR